MGIDVEQWGGGHMINVADVSLMDLDNNRVRCPPVLVKSWLCVLHYANNYP